jgi:hypothetical protein
MTKTFKYTDEETYNDFVLNLTTNLIDEDLIQMVMQPAIIELTSSRILPKGWSEDKALKTTECILYLLEDNEKYETCQDIITAWPELKRI